MLEIKYAKDQCLAIVDADAYLSVMTTAIQSCAEWLLCRGINRFSILRDKTPKGDGVLTFRPINQRASPAAFSSVCKLQQLVDERYLPKTIGQQDRWVGRSNGLQSFRVIEGSERISGVVKDEGYTVIPFKKINGDMTVNHYAFSFIAESIVPLFIIGSRFVRHQSSIEVSENQYDISMSQDQLRAFAESDMGYNPQSIIADLPK